MIVSALSGIDIMIKDPFPYYFILLKTFCYGAVSLSTHVPIDSEYINCYSDVIYVIFIIIGGQETSTRHINYVFQMLSVFHGIWFLIEDIVHF